MSIRRSSAALGAALLLAAHLAPASLQAQRAPLGRRGQVQNREQLEQRIREQMGRVMRERLGLDEEQAARLSEVVGDFDGRRRELVALEQATRRRVEALILEGGSDQAEARTLIERMSALRLQEAELFEAEQEALLGVLSPAQVLRLHALRQELGQRIRALRGGRGAEPRRGGRAPVGPGPGAMRDRGDGGIGGRGGPLARAPEGVPSLPRDRRAAVGRR
ncbi:MAG TPA: Spy/CpxP family protein refolding chaperone [Longimicrobiales bacterium]|nr:Spy/CpxP family protein refolding chaperone [Longimicrobiales bacterium]